MKKINVTAIIKNETRNPDAHRAGVEKLLSAVEAELSQPRRTERKTSYMVVYQAIRRAESILAPLPRVKWETVTVRYRVGAGKFPKCYKYQAMGDVLTLQYIGRAWYLVAVDREDVKDMNTVSVEMSTDLMIEYARAEIASACR